MYVEGVAGYRGERLVRRCGVERWWVWHVAVQ
jgi:hypothetical protein